MSIHKEPNATPDVVVDPDYENRILDLAIATLEDVAECDESCVLIRWVSVAELMRGRVAAGSIGRKVPLLYILFSEVVATRGNLPRVHINELGKVWPAHAVCLATLPAMKLLEGDAAKGVIRRGVEAFLLKHNVTRVTHAAAGENI